MKNVDKRLAQLESQATRGERVDLMVHTEMPEAERERRLADARQRAGEGGTVLVWEVTFDNEQTT